MYKMKKEVMLKVALTAKKSLTAINYVEVQALEQGCRKNEDVF